MNEYTDWRLTLRLLSPLGTPMQSDTIFGHLCWQVAFKGGEEAVNEFLEPFRNGAPPFVLSDAFPAGVLPKPLFPRIQKPVDTRKEYAEQKLREKAPFLEVSDFLQYIRIKDTRWKPANDSWIRTRSPHASINRKTGSTGAKETGEAGRFYHTEGLTVPGGCLEIYVRCFPEWADRLVELFHELSRVGFGKDKSVGFGAFALEKCDPWHEYEFFDQADCFVSLSSFVPVRQDPIEGRWRFRIKRGRLGEHAGAGNPFKKPLVQFEAGSVFQTNGLPLPFYGRIVPDMAPGMREAVQCGYCLTVPAIWRDT